MSNLFADISPVGMWGALFALSLMCVFGLRKKDAADQESRQKDRPAEQEDDSSSIIKDENDIK